MYIRNFLRIFSIAFFLNLIWENLHSLLYAHYKGGLITEAILVRASFWDATFITLSAVFFTFMTSKKMAMFASATILFLTSIVIEKWALLGGRWAYGELMPIIPVLETGLTPTIQLALLGYLTYTFTIKPFCWDVHK